MLRNGDFSESWETLPAIEEVGWLRNQRPHGWQIEWLEIGQPLYDDPNSTAKGIPECVHKLSTQLPPDEQLGAKNALILAGNATYKIFHSGASFGATLSQMVQGLPAGAQATLVVPIQTHLREETDPYGAESGVWVNGEGTWVNGMTMGDRNWYEHEVTFTVPANGVAEVVIRVKSKWENPKDFFIDGVTLTVAEVPISPYQPEPIVTTAVASPSTTKAHIKMVAAPSGLWLRSGPSTEHQQLTLMPNGTAVTILQEKVDVDEQWDFVRLGEQTGYAFRQYLRNGINFTAKPYETPEFEDDLESGTTTTRLGVGMNINPDAPHSNPLQDGSLKGLDWVRFPFKAADKHRTVTASFAEYDSIVKGYAAQGVGSLIILNQQTIAGEYAPWPDKKWTGMVNQYADKLASAAGEIAARYASLGSKVAYQIWNEGDNPETPWVSVYVPPEHFATILSRVAQAIRAASPQSPIVFGGLSTGPHQATAYVQACRKALGGNLPVDAIGLHPYGRWPRKQPFAGWGFGKLDDVFALFNKAIPDKPLWITEVGIPGGDKPLQAEHYPAVAEYLRDFHLAVAQKYAKQVPVIIWFAWSDNMENAGIVTSSGQKKPHIFDAFTAVRDRQII